MAEQGYPASGTRFGNHPGSSGYPAPGTRFGSHPGGSVPESRAAASVGVFTTNNYLSSAVANNFDLDSAVITCFEVLNRTGSQSICGTAGSTGGGWQYQFSSSVMSLFFTGGTTIAHAEGPPAVGLNIMADSRLSGGTVRGCKNGAAAAVRNGGVAPTYVANSGTNSTAIGRAPTPLTASACAGTRVLWQARLGRAATDAEMQEWTDTVNLLDRYKPPATLVAAVQAQDALVPGSSWLFDADTDYNSANATSPTGIGTGPTWTRNSSSGSGFPAKNTIAAEIEHTIDLSDWHYNVQDIAMTSTAGVSYRRGNAFREYKFTTDAVRFVVKGLCDWSGITNMANLGVRQDDVPLTPLNFDRFGVMRRLDVMSLSGSHAYRIIDGAQSLSGGASAGVYNSTAVKAITSVLVQAPKTATFTVTAPSPSANRLVVIGDSFAVGQYSTVTPTTESEVMMMRADYPGDVIAFAFGTAAHWHFFKDATTYNALIADLATAFSGATSKRILNLLGVNDHGFHTTFYTNRADMISKAGAGYDALHAADSAITFHGRTPLLRTGAYEGSTVSDATPVAGTGGGTAVGGVILQNVRDDLATVQSTRSAWLLTMSNGVPIFPNFAPSTNHSATDNFHPTGWTGGVASGGHNTIKVAAKTTLGAASDAVGTGY